MLRTAIGRLILGIFTVALVTDAVCGQNNQTTAGLSWPKPFAALRMLPSIARRGRPAKQPSRPVFNVDPYEQADYELTQYQEHELLPAVPVPEQEAIAGPLQSDTIAPEVIVSPLPADGIETVEGPFVDIAPGVLDADIPLEVCDSGSWGFNGRWFSQQEVIMLTRTEVSEIALATDRSAVGALSEGGLGAVAPPNLLMSSMPFHYEPGTRLTIGRILGKDKINRNHNIEFTFFGLFDHVARGQLAAERPVFNEFVGDGSVQPSTRGIDTLLTPFSPIPGRDGFGMTAIPDSYFTTPLTGFSSADFQRADYESELNSFELNLRIRARPGRDRMVMQPNGNWVRQGAPSKISSVLVGLRHMKITELFLYSSEIIPSDYDPRSGAGLYSVDMNNDMYGVQLGGDIRERYSEWNWGVRGKVAGLANFVDRRSTIDSSADTYQRNPLNATIIQITGRNEVNRDENISDTSLVFLAEGGVFAAYQVRPDTTFHIGYEVMYMTGLAVASNNIGLGGNFVPFNLTGDALYHGMSVGFEMVW